MDEHTKKIHEKYISKSKIAPEYKKYNIETNAGVRWETGISHHPKSEELMKHVSELDFCFTGDYFCWKTGGDGDNGEALMYLMDMYFELQDAKLKASQESLGVKIPGYDDDWDSIPNIPGTDIIKSDD